MKNLLTAIASVLLLTTTFFQEEARAQQLVNSSREKVHFSQKLDPESKPQLADRAIETESRVFHRKISGAELNRGVELTTDADEAVIQISPLDSVKNGKRIRNTEVPRGLTLSNGRERRPVSDDSIALHRKSQGLREHFPGFYGRAHAMRVPADMGHGRLRLEAHGSAPNDTEYVVYVLDKNSETALQVEAPKARFVRGERLILDARIKSNSQGKSNAGAGARLESAAATLIAPSGERYALNGRLEGGNYRVDWPIQVDAPRQPGRLWQVEVRSTIKGIQGQRLERVATVAADIFEPTAAVESVYSDANGLRLAMDVREPGRYEVRALVQGRGRSGDYQPALLNYQAEWLEAGKREFTIPVDSADLTTSGLTPPYRVQSLQLLDQSRMAVLEYRHGNWVLATP